MSISKIDLYKFISTVGYIGYVPYAPGTVGSLVACLLFYFIPSRWTIAIILLFFVVGTFSSYKVSVFYSKSDPQVIVIDEFVGMGISVLMLPKFFYYYFIAFLIFRFFDITKPYLIYKIQDISYGFGIMIDDVFAGLITFFIMHILILINF